MKRATYALIAAASIGAAIWWWSGSDKVAPEGARVSTAGTAAADHADSRPELPPPPPGTSANVEAVSSEQSAAPDIRTQFHASNDYWEFAERVHEAAKRGDGAAQYYLSIAIERCEFLYDAFFIEQRRGSPPRVRTLDEAQQITATQEGSNFGPEDVRDIQSRCQRIMNTKPPPFGSYREWMEAALASGYPLAQVRASFYKALQGRDNPPTENFRAAHSEARELAFDALRSKDPEVVWWMGSTAAALTGDEPGEVHKRQWTWRMAACLREQNCNAMAEWRSILCEVDSQCHRDDTVMDLIRRGAGNDLTEIERRARELNEKIDAGTIDESDI